MVYQSIRKYRLWVAAVMVVAMAIESWPQPGLSYESEGRSAKFRFRSQTRNHEPVRFTAPFAAGDLDPTFGIGGKVTTDFSSSELAYATALQADGKIVAAGAIEGGETSDFAVFRYNSDGTLDTTFGGGDGKVTTPIVDYSAATSVAIQSDGKIVAAGYAGDYFFGNFALVRYNADGSLDNMFGNRGVVITQLLFSSINDIVIQPDGRIVVAGIQYDYKYLVLEFTVARYDTNGTLDASFGTFGIVTTDFDGENGESATTVVLQADGKIVAAGRQASLFGYSRVVVARYNADGSLDTSFDSDGTVITSFDGYAYANAAAIRADGKIVVAGAGGQCDPYGCGVSDFALVRYNPDGSLDTSFDGDGRVMTDFANDWDEAYGTAFQSDGRVVVSGYASASGITDFALARYNDDGSLDTAFDADGKVTTDFGGREDGAADIAVERDGDIVAVGSGANASEYNDDFLLSRYGPDGSLDTSFGGDGRVETSLFTASSRANAIASMPDDRMVAAGVSNNGTAGDDFAIVRYSEGYRDLSFHYDGKVTTDFANSQDVANSVALQPDRKVIAAGYTDGGTKKNFALVRYNFDGTLDKTFGNGGKVVTAFGALDDEARAVVVQSDGKIVVAGYSSLDNTLQFQLAIARFNADGSLDPTFSDDGKLVEPVVQGANALSLQPDGKIVAGGGMYSPGRFLVTDFAVVRYNPDGTHDTTFAADGVARTEFQYSSYIQSIVVGADGLITSVGFAATGNSATYDFALARHNPNGSPDTSFDVDGKLNTSFGHPAIAHDIVLQRNGKTLAAGSAGEDFAITRYEPDGVLDPSFGLDGKVTTDFFGQNDFGAAAALQVEGKIVVAGSADKLGRTHFAVARYIGDPVRSGFDYDGDGRADVSVFRAGLTGGAWYILYSSTRRSEQLNAGFPGTKIVPADYDGDGRTDIAQYDASSGTWYIRRSQSGPVAVRFGMTGDVPAPADYDGDGKADVAVYRPSSGTWWILRSSDGSFETYHFGLASDKPVAGDYDADGKSDLAVYRPSEGMWYILRSTAGFTAVRWGTSGDQPVVGDYDGDRRHDPGVYRPGTNTWYVLKSSNGSFLATAFGAAGDVPAPADFDGDGRTDVSVFRPSTGVWYILQTVNGAVRYTQFGIDGDLPTQSAFIMQ